MCFTLLGLVGLLMLLPELTPGSASAASLVVAPLSPDDPALSLDVSTVDLELFSGSTFQNDFDENYLTINTKTNSPYGYALYLNMADTNTCLRHTSDIGTACASIASNAKFSAGNPKSNVNEWGYSLNGGTTYYAPLAAGSSTAITPAGTGIRLYEIATPPGGDYVVVAFGAKASPALKPGSYVGQMVLTAAPNAPPEPIIYSVSPATGVAGDTITITGDILHTAHRVQVGSTDCTSATIVDEYTITCVVPAGTPGATVNVTVTTWGGSAIAPSSFTYDNPAPVIDSVSPNTGHFRGGETITITGSNFTGATEVFAGGECASFHVVSDTTITCVTPGVPTVHLSGPNNTLTNTAVWAGIFIFTPYGTAGHEFLYRYLANSFSTGGSFMDIRGEDIALGSKIYVNGVECTNRKITSATTAACNTPATSTGAQSVTIQAPTSSGNMQNWTGCAALGGGTPPYTTTNWAPYTTVLTDTRNGQDYRVRKMPDGRCWMIDNMKLADYTLTSADSNVSSSFTIPANPVQSTATHSNGTGHTANGSGYLTTNGATYDASNYAFIAYSDPSLSDNAQYYNCINQYGISSNTLTGCGYLYNWYTATAGTGDYNASISTASASICPAGWLLPTGDNAGQFAILNSAMATGSTSPSTTNSATTRPNWRHNGPFEGSLAGQYTTRLDYTGYYGYYWSSSGGGVGGTYSLLFSNSAVNPSAVVVNRFNGWAVRCVL